MSGAPPAPPLDLEQARAQIAEYERHRLQLEAQLLQAQRASQAPSSSLSRSSNSGRPRGPDAPEFNGAHIKGFEVDSWVREMKKQFAFYGPIEFPTDAAKVRHAAFFLKGAAAEWWDTVDKRDANGNDITADWEAFVARLRERYRPLQASAIARQRIDALRQKGPVSAYCDLFQKELTPITTMSDEDQVFFFVKGLASQAVQAKVREKDPVTLHDAMDIAVRAEVYQGKGQIAFGYRSYGSSAPMDVNAVEGEVDESESESREMSPQQMLAAMEKMFVAAINQQKPAATSSNAKSSSGSSSSKSRSGSGHSGRRNNRIPGLKFEQGEIDALKRANRCFKCKEVGHMKGECQNEVKLNW